MIWNWLKNIFGKKEITKMGDDLFWLIKRYEGCRLDAYLCPAGVPTIGWGSTFYPDGSKVKLGDKITQQVADDLLMWYCITQIKLPCRVFSCNQKAALYSLIYNIGQGAFDRSKCRKAIEAENWSEAYANWNWTKAGGKELPGLVRRRNEEKAIFFEGLI